MTAHLDRIYSWIDGLPSFESHTRNKRKPSVDMNPKKPLKRRRVAKSSRNTGSTNINRASDFASEPISSLPPSSLSTRKQILNLELLKDGLICRSIGPNTDPVPAKVTALLARIQKLNRGMELFPYSSKEVILKSPLIGDPTLWEHAFKSPSVKDTLPGHVPAPDVMNLICSHANFCQDSGQSEAAWNMDVHHRLLEAVFRNPGSREGDLLNIAPCTAARPHPTFLPTSVAAKMVDFCLYFNKSNFDDFEALESLVLQNPTFSVNHTDFAPLKRSPIALSIETKSSGKEEQTSQLQMGVWHIAQLNFLRSVIGTSPQLNSRHSRAEESLIELGFIPGIIICGHRWEFVFSHMDGQRTALRIGQVLGSTRNIVDAYSIVAGLREIASWLRDVYLPWFKSKVLSGFSSVESVSSQLSNPDDKSSEQDIAEDEDRSIGSSTDRSLDQHRGSKK